jgi:hypothetical protein
MRVLNILIILACVIGGYWLVSSIMGPGIDPNRTRKPDPKPIDNDTGTATGSVDREAAIRAHDRDWHLILDLPANANRREIEAAYKRRLSKAESAGDSFETIRIRRAYEAAIRRTKP